MTVTLQQRPAFKRVYKKLHANQRDAVHTAMRELIANPLLGEEKKGDLAGVWVHKFDCINQLYLLAYLWDETTRTWLSLGPHENFYRDLKR
ncbi:type II toxin-antitoxin system RelE/ParE family toxin [Allochromatium palmeri]|uniref:Type II toxin-antitoxin system RelE/ParE family toxin n=1 Tax=Allochromatium palmeri TaxID=231048 RepID=A0A6N8EL18_9GAMM|nr:type II toxin-antitoxin system RelE/ParE family toxin [Allochromatium palmeri]MTW23257.1 type II toxin-antitoxin system RelE/ParE family toxin [Allochromatium palmeri]